MLEIPRSPRAKSSSTMTNGRDRQGTFVKHVPGAHPDAYGAEAAGLRWLAQAEPSGGARVAHVLELTDTDVTIERVDTSRPKRQHARAFGQALAVTHDSGAEAFGSPPPGWTGQNYIGRREQECCPMDVWGTFYAEQRVLPFAAIAHSMGALDTAGFNVVARVCRDIADGAFDDGTAPSRLHGDLWSGNVLWTDSGVVMIDPAAHGGHRETDLAMLALFGCPYLDEIIAGYETVHPLRDGWQERIPLHQLHPLATHAAGHGSAYASALVDAARQTQRLLA